MQNPEDLVFRDGRMTSRPSRRWPRVTVARIDFDVLHARLLEPLSLTLMGYNPIRRQFDGTQKEIDDAIKAAAVMLLDQALFELWNRLRVVAETYDFTTRTNVFKLRAPRMEGFQLPRFYASLLSSIGPLRIDDSFFDTTVIYAPAQALRDNFGRAQMPDIVSQDILHFIHQLESARIPLGTIQYRGSQGSFFTTCARVKLEDDSFNIIGAFNARHYSRADTVMGMLLGPFGDTENPFEDLSATLGFVSSEELITGLERVVLNDAANNGNPPAATTRHILGDYNIAYSGIAPASDVPVVGRGPGMYILGQGYDRIGTCSLARDLSGLEIAAILRHRLIQAPTN